MAGAFILWGVASHLPSSPTPVAGYMGGRSRGWYVEPAWPWFGESFLLSLAKARMGFWAQVVEWVPSSKEDLLGQMQGCRDGDAWDRPGPG